MDKEMIDLVSNLEFILDAQKNQRFTTENPTYLLNALKKMGVTDIAAVTDEHVDARYVDATPEQKKILDDIHAARMRFIALKGLNKEGGLYISDAEKNFFDAQNKKQRAAMAAAANAMKQNA